MTNIVFLLGRPGSGKSRTARCIEEAASGPEYRVSELSYLKGWSVIHATDYDFLYRMFREDMEKEESLRRFCPTSFGGFEVRDFSVLDLALQQVNSCITPYLHKENTLILIEFARRDYSHEEVWQHFYDEMLRDAFFLYLEADIKICIERIEKRAIDRLYPDDQYVPHEVMHSYYSSSAGEPARLKQLFGQERVMAIENNGAWGEAWVEINHFLQKIPARIYAPQRQMIELVLAG